VIRELNNFYYWGCLPFKVWFHWISTCSDIIFHHLKPFCIYINFISLKHKEHKATILSPHGPNFWERESSFRNIPCYACLRLARSQALATLALDRTSPLCPTVRLLSNYRGSNFLMVTHPRVLSYWCLLSRRNAEKIHDSESTVSYSTVC
jgi:hypothetical protein